MWPIFMDMTCLCDPHRSLSTPTGLDSPKVRSFPFFLLPLDFHFHRPSAGLSVNSTFSYVSRLLLFFSFLAAAAAGHHFPILCQMIHDSSETRRFCLFQLSSNGHEMVSDVTAGPGRSVGHGYYLIKKKD